MRVLFDFFINIARWACYGVDPFENYDSLNSFYLLMDKPEVYGLPSDPVTPTKYMAGDYLRGAATLILCAAAVAACLV